MIFILNLILISVTLNQSNNLNLLNKQENKSKYLEVKPGEIDSFYLNIDKYHSLETLVINNHSHLNLDTLFIYLTRLEHLKSLTLANNSLKLLPASLGNLQSLERLELTNNDIQTIPKEISKLENLHYISFTGCKIKELDSIINPLVRIRGLKQIDLDDMGLTQFPCSVFQLQFIEGISLSFNYINKIPNDICDLQYLRYLNISHNKFTEYPKSLKCINLDLLQLTPFNRNDHDLLIKLYPGVQSIVFD